MLECMYMFVYSAVSVVRVSANMRLRSRCFFFCLLIFLLFFERALYVYILHNNIIWYTNRRHMKKSSIVKTELSRTIQTVWKCDKH